MDARRLPLDEWVLPGVRYRSTAGDIAFALVLRLENELQGKRQADDLQQAETYGQENARTDEKSDEWGAPHKRINCI